MTIEINIYKDYKYYKVIISDQEFIMYTSFGKKHAINLAIKQWKDENHPKLISCEEII